MIYKRSPYFQNVSAKNNRSQYLLLSDILKEFIEVASEEEDFFEIGFNLGERITTLNKSGMNVVGGVEFDPMFGTYGNKHFGIYENYRIILTNLDDWFDSHHKNYYTYKFLEEFSDLERQVLTEKIKEMADKYSSAVYFMERFNIPNTKRIGEIQIYVGSNGIKIDDRDSSSQQVQQDTSESVNSDES